MLAHDFRSPCICFLLTLRSINFMVEPGAFRYRFHPWRTRPGKWPLWFQFDKDLTKRHLHKVRLFPKSFTMNFHDEGIHNGKTRHEKIPFEILPENQENPNLHFLGIFRIPFYIPMVFFSFIPVFPFPISPFLFPLSLPFPLPGNPNFRFPDEKAPRGAFRRAYAMLAGSLFPGSRISSLSWLRPLGRLRR